MNCNNKNMLMMNSCFRRVCSRKVLACSSLCQGSVSWIPRGKLILDLDKIVKWSLLSVHHRSCIPDPDSLSGRHYSQVWDLGHRWSGEVSQSGAHVLQGSPGCHRGLWHYQRRHLRESKVLGEGASETGRDQLQKNVDYTMICFRPAPT